VWWFIPIIPATQEAEMEEIEVQVHPGQKVQETPSQPVKGWVWWYTSVIPAMQKT
jgi:hypothetical protein